MRVEGALKIGVQLRLIDAPKRCDRLDRAILRPIAAQIGDWPAHAIHDLEARRMDRASLSAGSQPGAQRGNQTIAQMAGACEKTVYNRLRNTVIGQQIAARSDLFGPGLSPDADGIPPCMNGRLTLTIDHEQLPIVDEL